MLKLITSIRDCMPHPKHYLEVSKTILFKELKESHPRLNVSQRALESLMSFYCVRLNIQNISCNIMWSFL